MSEFPEVKTKLQLILANLRKQRFRSVLWISGQEQWCFSALTSLLSWKLFQDCVLVGEYEDGITDPVKKAYKSLQQIPQRQFHQALGQEFDLFVYNAYQGLNPDGIAAVSGCLRAGGLLVLISPNASQWAQFNDPEYSHIAVYPDAPESCPGYFLQRWVRELQGMPQLMQWQEEQPLELELPAAFLLDTSSLKTDQNGSSVDPSQGYFTEDQGKAVGAIKKVAKGHRNRPLVVTADRGRGKTSALGLAAFELMRDENPPKQIIVIAPRAEAVKPLFARLEMESESEKKSDFDFMVNESRIRYLSPDMVLDQWPAADLVLVDEAAALPVYILERLVMHYHRICFTTTVDGYEGTGRGFEIRFQPLLNKVRPQWRLLNLSEPIRWNADDPLEQWIFKGCLLKFNAADLTTERNLKTSQINIDRISQQQLANDESLLRQVIGLLSLAHYRTTPGDLRNILDGSNIEVVLVRSISSPASAGQAETELLGLMLLAREGRFEEELSENIWRGKRRPRGHLLPQALAVNVGVRDALVLSSLRVIRIAVHPNIQGQGLGAGLLDWLDQYAKETQVDFVGTSYSMTPELLNFWQSSNFNLVRIGLQKEKSSGCHAALMIKPISPPGQACCDIANQAFADLFPHLLLRSYQQLDVDLLIPIMAHFPSPVSHWKDFTEYDRSLLQGFANGDKSLQVCLMPVMTLIRWGLNQYQWESIEALDRRDVCLFIAHVLQGKEFSVLNREFELASQKQLNSALQRTTTLMLQALSKKSPS